MPDITITFNIGVLIHIQNISSINADNTAITAECFLKV